VITATVDGPGGDLRVVNGYFVNGQAPGSDKFAYKMNWLGGLNVVRLRRAEAASPAGAAGRLQHRAGRP
jgi:exonuclease III